MKTNDPSEWIRTDEQAVLNDIKRLGMEAAVEYQMGLIADRSAAGDTRWDEITADDMQEALEDLLREQDGYCSLCGRVHDAETGTPGYSCYQN